MLLSIKIMVFYIIIGSGSFPCNAFQIGKNHLIESSLDYIFKVHKVHNEISND